ncbi:MAG: hypothetical protein Q9180_002571, partial [Flavoplaca navasiana]
DANFGIRGTAKALAQVSSSGKMAQDRRKDFGKDDEGVEEVSGQKNDHGQKSKSEQKQPK